MALSQNAAPGNEQPGKTDKQAAQVEKLDAKHADILAAAAASGDAGVHNLLGQRAIAELNQDEAALKDIDKQLGELLK